jgi:hypothetical protein
MLVAREVSRPKSVTVMKFPAQSETTFNGGAA